MYSFGVVLKEFAVGFAKSRSLFVVAGFSTRFNYIVLITVQARVILVIFFLDLGAAAYNEGYQILTSGIRA